MKDEDDINDVLQMTETSNILWNYADNVCYASYF